MTTVGGRSKARHRSDVLGARRRRPVEFMLQAGSPLIRPAVDLQFQSEAAPPAVQFGAQCVGVMGLCCATGIEGVRNGFRPIEKIKYSLVLPVASWRDP